MEINEKRFVGEAFLSFFFFFLMFCLFVLFLFLSLLLVLLPLYGLIMTKSKKNISKNWKYKMQKNKRKEKTPGHLFF